MKHAVELLIFLYCAIAVLFASIIWSIMLVDGISPKELSKCLDHRAPFLTNSSK